MSFGAPELLALLLVLPLLGLLLWRSLAARERAMRSLLSAEAAEALGAGAEVTRRRRRQAWAALWAVALGLVAATGPQLGFVWQQQRVEGVTLAAVLDVSRSMQAQDVSPSRMEVARRKLDDLSRLLRGDAIGLVIFARGAWLRLPPTVDYDTFRWALADSEPAMIRAQGTSLAGALTLAVEMLARAEGSGKAIILLSDGEAHDEQAELQAAAAAAREAEVRIYAIGIGTADGAPIPLTEGGFKEDASGNLVVSHADPEILKALASATGGAYVPAVPSEEDVRMIYEQEIRGKLQAAVRGVRSEKVWQERYQWPLSLAFFLAIWGSLQGIGRRRTPGAGAPPGTATAIPEGLLPALLLAILLPLAAQAGAADGLAAWRAGRFDEAIRLLGQARVEDPADVEVGRALAESLYRAGRYQEAESLFRSLAAQAPTAEERAAWTYNAGNAAYRAGRLQDALSRYEEAGRILPSLDPASQNAELVREEIRRREQKEQEKQQQQEQQEQQQQGQQQEQQGQGQQGQGQQQEQQGQQDQQAQQDQQGQQQGQQDQQAQQGQQGQQGQQDQQGQQQGQQDQQGQQGQQPPEGKPEGAQAKPGEGGEGGEQSDVDQQGEAATQADPVEPGGMSKEEAARLVESVPDGRPQGVIGGASDGRDW